MATLTQDDLKTSKANLATVDAAAGIIYGARVNNARSPAEVEGAKVRCISAKPGSRYADQSAPGVADVFGILKNARSVNGVVRADVHYLKTHPAAPLVVEDIERDLRQFALYAGTQGTVRLADNLDVERGQSLAERRSLAESRRTVAPSRTFNHVEMFNRAMGRTPLAEFDKLRARLSVGHSSKRISASKIQERLTGRLKSFVLEPKEMYRRVMGK